MIKDCTSVAGYRARGEYLVAMEAKYLPTFEANLYLLHTNMHSLYYLNYSSVSSTKYMNSISTKSKSRMKSTM